MKKLTVDIVSKPKDYEVVFPENFSELEEDLLGQIGGRRGFLVTDENVVRKSGFDVKGFAEKNNLLFLVLPPGEKHKHWDTVEKILTFAFENHFDRGEIFVAVGGGVIGDMVGFAASVFMRGVPVIQVPTSLLAMVDASVGGKTGIDCKFGKNLIGSFYQPERICCCLDFLKTLPNTEVLNGVAEMLKHGVIGSEKHFNDLVAVASKTPSLDALFPLVVDSIRIKRDFVEADEKEAGRRMHLNLGHTFGHAIELLSDFKIPHGYAVAIGAGMAADFAVKQGICSEGVARTIRDGFDKFGFDLKPPFAEDDIFEAMKRDKKVRNGVVKLVLPKRVGEVVVRDLQKV